MKKLILILLVLPFFAEAQTIPNGNFETWNFVGWFENPESWVTDNTQILTTVTKDYDSYEGEIAMRVTAVPNGIGEYGEAYTLIEANSVPATLNFYAKGEFEFGGAFIEIAILNGDNTIYTQYWNQSESMPEYTFISIPLNQIEPIFTHIRIKVVAQVGDLLAGSAWISVDAMEFGQPTGLFEANKLHFKIFPNPSSDKIAIQAPQGLIGPITIVDAQGKKVYEEFIATEKATITIQDFPKGIYTIVGLGDTRVVGKFVVN